MQLPVNHQQQISTALCWAACASMVCDFYGQPVTQTKLAAEFNLRFGHGLNAMATPAETAHLIGRLTNKTVTMDLHDEPLSWDKCVQCITMRRLILVTRQNHQIVISGFAPADPRGRVLWINDPGIHNAARVLYDTLAQDWIASLVKT
ncbi:MAG: papain-like cysteine protease family protein [Dongiaceae bacterium]|jgi:ABC-type bacteriocin/lantibiotic exporter with double-glycine peptidase domain